MAKEKSVRSVKTGPVSTPSAVSRVSDVDLVAVSAHIARTDPAFAKLIDHVGPCEITSNRDGSIFESLAYSVVAQQLSTKAADTIGGRLVELVGSPLTAEAIAACSAEALRGVGLSGSKTKTLLGLAHVALDGSIDLTALWDLPDEEVHRQLTALWGIGRWTAEMTMIFNMGRLDVWPVGDLAVRKGWGIIHRMEMSPTAEQIESMADHLRPYRSVVAWYCWRATDTKDMDW